MGLRLGVDIGGTFTDLAPVDEETSKQSIWKVPSTPDDYSAAVIDAIKALSSDRDVAPEAMTFLSHATTVVTNAILESKGARAALITSRIHIVDKEGNKKPIQGKGPAFSMPAGSEVWYDVAGSGGYGNPEERDREALRQDVIDGYVSEESAAQDYGIEDVEELRCPYCDAIEREDEDSQ